ACARSWWACTSSRVTMPPGPVPATLARSTPRSLASLRTGGFARPGRCTWAVGALVRVAARGGGAGAGGALGAGRAAGAGAGGAVAAGAAGAGSAARRRRRAVPGSTVPYPTSTEPEPDAAGAAASGASAPPGTVAAGADGAAGASPAGSVSTTMIGTPTSTVVPSGARISLTTPVYGDGSSTSDFAVSISTIVWLTVTASPTATCHCTISASVRPSPASGRL